MSNPPRRWAILVWTVALGLSLGGCSSDDSGPKAPAYVDPQGREIIPCTGDLCFDSADPEVSEGLDAFIQFYDENVAGGADHEYIQRMTDSFAACNYTRGKTGVIQADCPDWVEFKGCPPKFYLPITAVVDLENNPNRHYCVEDSVPGGAGCGVDLACADGKVCTGALSSSWTDDLDDGVPICISASACVKIASSEAVSVSDRACFYSDFTVPKTGAPAPQDCEALAEGTCAVNCPCDSVENPSAPGLFIDRCLFVSEERPVGICASRQACSDGSTCIVPGSVCAAVQSPAWVQDYADTRPPAWKVSPSEERKGYCVMKDVCDAWSAANPGVIVDGCDDVSIPPPTP